MHYVSPKYSEAAKHWRVCVKDCESGHLALVQAAIVTLTTFGVIYFAAVRLDDGICAVHDRYVSASSAWARYAA